MHRSHLVATVFAFIAALVFAGPSVAGSTSKHHRCGHDEPDAGMFKEHAERLGLDEKTLADIQKVVETSQTRSGELKSEMRTAYLELHTLLSQDLPKERDVMKLAERIGKLDTEKRKQRLAAVLKVRSLLTSEQRAELVKIREEKKEAFLAPIREACAEDMERLCPGMGPGPERGMCLHEHKAELSEGCRSAVREMHGGHHQEGKSCSEKSEGDASSAE